MAYTKVGPFTNGAPPAIDKTFLDGVEDYLARTPDADDASAGFVPVGDGSGAWVYEKLPASSISGYPASATKALLGDGSWAQIANAQVATAAAIAYSKLALTGALLDADVASGANLHKLAAVTGTADGTKFLRDDGAWAAAGTVIKHGSASVAWPGGASLSSGTSVTHGVGSTPGTVLAAMNGITSGITEICAVQVTSIGATTFQLFAQTIDGATPAAGSAIVVSWLAIA